MQSVGEVVPMPTRTLLTRTQVISYPIPTPTQVIERSKKLRATPAYPLGQNWRRLYTTCNLCYWKQSVLLSRTFSWKPVNSSHGQLVTAQNRMMSWPAAETLCCDELTGASTERKIAFSVQKVTELIISPTGRSGGTTFTF